MLEFSLFSHFMLIRFFFFLMPCNYIYFFIWLINLMAAAQCVIYENTNL